MILNMTGNVMEGINGNGIRREQGLKT